MSCASIGLPTPFLADNSKCSSYLRPCTGIATFRKSRFQFWFVTSFLSALPRRNANKEYGSQASSPRLSGLGSIARSHLRGQCKGEAKKATKQTLGHCKVGSFQAAAANRGARSISEQATCHQAHSRCSISAMQPALCTNAGSATVVAQSRTTNRLQRQLIHASAKRLVPFLA